MNLGNADQPGDSGPIQNQSSFEALIALARDGDINAVGALIDNYRNYLLFVANEDVDQNLKSKIGASDVVQESLMHAQLNIDRFTGNTETEWKAWLRSILGNDIRKSRRTFRTRKRDTNLEINIQEKSAVGRSLLDQHLTPSSQAIHQEKASAITTALSRLTADQQQVVKLRNFEQLSFEDIGKSMNRSADAARKLWARAIESLKQSLNSVSPEIMGETANGGEVGE